MSKSEKEVHPYLITGQSIPNATRMILGSFPVYACTNPDNPKKKELRNKHNDIVRFFYGSHKSQFWNLYKKYVDAQIDIPIVKSQILTSLANNHLAISDTIKSCERLDYSASDSGLKEIEWNKEGINDLFVNGVKKVLCTSKGVLCQLEKHIICTYGNPTGDDDPLLSKNLQTHFINQIGGIIKDNMKPLAKVFRLDDGKIIEAIAIPSPGSYWRSIQHFGFNKGDKKAYADKYFKYAFNWLLI